MGKSRRKTQRIKITGTRMSNKLNKQVSNRYFRRTSRHQLNDKLSRPEPEVKFDGLGNIIPDGYKETYVYTKTREATNEYDWNTEGTAVYCRNLQSKYMRK